MGLFKINKGDASNLPSTIREGYAYVTQDEADFYIDISNTERIRIGDIIKVANESDLPLLTAVENHKWYYVKESGELKTYQDGGWFTINSLEALDIAVSAEVINYLSGAKSNIQEQIDKKSDEGHTHKYAGSSTAGGAANSANKLNTDAGSATQPVYFADGVPVKTTYTLGASVPSDAKFTDTTYSDATTTKAGLLSVADKKKLDTITENADAVSFTQTATSGNKIGSIFINGTEFVLYAPIQTDVTGNAGTADKLKTARTITLGGDATGSVSFDGSKDVTLTVAVKDDSHNHIISNIDGLQDALNGKEAAGAVNTHNTATDAHNDIRLLVSNLTTKVNNFLNVSDTATDQLSEILALIDANADSIADITSNKINVADIINNLTTNVSNKPLSAAQGVVLKGLIDSLDTNKVDKVSGKGLSANDYTTTEKNKLAGIAEGANKYVHPSHTAKSNGFYKVTVDSLGHVSGTAAVTKADITGLGIPAQDTTYSAATTSASGLMSAADKKKLDGIAEGANNYTYTLPNATSSILGGVKIGSNINVSNGTISVPTADGTTAGVTIVYPAASCTTFSSDSGTVTPLAVQKGAKMFSITRPASSTNKAITRYSNTTGDVQDSKIIIEDVTNSKDSSKKAQVIAIPAEGGKKMVYGYCTDQVDGTSFIGGVFDANATSYPYAQGLAIGGTSGNLLWKGVKVATVSDTVATASKLETSAGSASVPVYFSGGKPVACTGIKAYATWGDFVS
ncbi:MAG: hypothetical protein IKT40_06115 [Bacilli bacterium]|nr:hypothetical protein [Bacilli bacterium]